MARASIKDILLMLDWVPYIHYLLCFQKYIVRVKALINYSSEVNAMILNYALKLGLKVCYTNIGAQKIDGSIFEIFEMVLANF